MTPGTDDLIDLESLLADSVTVAMHARGFDAFLAWTRSRLPTYAAETSPLRADPHMARAFAFAWSRALWNGLPLNAAGERPKPVPAPGRNEPCPCGSGRPFKQCCATVPPIPVLGADLLWPFVLAGAPAAQRKALVAGRRVPARALFEFASRLTEANRSAEVIRLLEPRLAAPSLFHDADTALLLDALCDAYGMTEKGARLKVRLLNRIVEQAPRSPLRSEAWQRLATIRMDRGDRQGAWEAFRNALQDEPRSESLPLLEMQLLIVDGRIEEARRRAQFWLVDLRRSGVPPNDPRVQFLRQVRVDPLAAQAGIAIDMEGGAGRSLREWLSGVARRPVPLYALEPAQYDPPETDGARPRVGLTPPAEIVELERRWHEVFPLDKPFSIQTLPFSDIDAWDPDVEARWGEFLEAHPEAFDSIDILDDLATAVAAHPAAGVAGIEELLFDPLLTRIESIVDHACEGSDPILWWALEENRPALRGLLRKFQRCMARDDRDGARATAERLLHLNPDDHHGMRLVLVNDYLREGRNAEALALASQYPHDIAPETRFGAVLALLRLQRPDEAERALHSACRDLPKVVPCLLRARVRRPKLDTLGITVGGDDQAWLYREEMRPAWRQTPGALDWLRSRSPVS